MKKYKNLGDALLDLPGVFVVVADEQFTLEWANPYFYEYFQCAARDVTGRPLHDFLGTGLAGDMDAGHVARVFREGLSQNYDARTLNALGEEITVRWNQRVLRDKKGLRLLSLGVVLPPPPKADDGYPLPVVVCETALSGIYTGGETDNDDRTEDLGDLAPESVILHFQPRVAARTKTIVGAEALARLSHPERGLLMPAEFIPPAERTGAIVGIGANIIKAVCQKLKQWQTLEARAESKLILSINVSPKQFLEAGFMKTMIDAAATGGIQPNRLLLEVPERTVAAHFNEVRDLFRHLRDAGFKVAVDHYTAGYLPPAALLELAVDNIKIDRACLARAAMQPAMYSVIESIFILAHGMGITVTAEGVENRNQLEFLIDHSVDFLQGYLLSHPLPEAEFDRLILQNPNFFTRHI